MASPSPAFKVNGGSVGADTSVTAGSTVSATLNSTDGVGIVTWSIARTDDTGTPGAYTLTPSGALGETVSFTAGAAGTAVALQCVINAGIDAHTEAASDACTATAKVYVPLASGLEVLVAGEQEDGNTESSSTHGITKPINAAIRALNSLASGTDVKPSVLVASTASMGATRSGNILTATANASINTAGIDGYTSLALNDSVLMKDQATGADRGIYTITDLGSAGSRWVMTRRSDCDDSAEVTAGTEVYVERGTANGETKWVLTTTGAITINTTSLAFERLPSTTEEALLLTATSAATASALCQRGGSGDCSFVSVSAGTNPATTGGFKDANNSGLVARNAANTGNVPLIKADGSDNAVVGATATVRDIQLSVPTGQAAKLYVNGNLITTLSEAGGGGVITTAGSMALTSAGTVAINAASYFDVEAAGTVYLSSAVPGGTPTFEFRGVGDAGVEKWTRTTVQTTDATVTTVASFTLTDATIYNVVADVRGLVTGGNGAGYLRAATVKRIGGGAVLIAAPSTPHTAEDNAAWDCTIDVSGNDARVRVTGAAATTINWSCLLKVTQ